MNNHKFKLPMFASLEAMSLRAELMRLRIQGIKTSLRFLTLVAALQKGKN